MKAKNNIGSGTGGVRNKLVDVLPLKTPLGIYFFPIYICNFRCNYCLHSIPLDKRNVNFYEKKMDFGVFKKCVDDMQKFEKKIKTIRFAGLGEPLLHEKISEMIKYITDSNVSDSTEIITNGSLLSYDMSDRLIESGLSRLSISLQGLNADMYRKISKADINYDKFVDQIKYFYTKKKETKLYIKILDCCLEQEDDMNKFYEIFGNICDYLSIEKVSPLVSEVDYTDIVLDSETTVRGYDIQDNDICSFPFYMMQINPNGDIIPCCSAEKVQVMGNVKNSSLTEIWNGKVFNDFRKIMLGGCDSLPNQNACKNCKGYKYSRFKEDIIDLESAKRLQDLY